MLTILFKIPIKKMPQFRGIHYYPKALLFLISKYNVIWCISPQSYTLNLIFLFYIFFYLCSCHIFIIIRQFAIIYHIKIIRDRVKRSPLQCRSRGSRRWADDIRPYNLFAHTGAMKNS